MARRGFTIVNDAVRARAIEHVRALPIGARVQADDEPKRSSEQSDKMWAMLDEVSAQAEWCGLKLDSDDWKCLFMSALDKEMRLVPNLDRTGYVSLGHRSSKLSKQAMSDLIEVIQEFGARNGVKFREAVDG